MYYVFRYQSGQSLKSCHKARYLLKPQFKKKSDFHWIFYAIYCVSNDLLMNNRTDRRTTTVSKDDKVELSPNHYVFPD